jgi:hypothetical protein
MGTPLFVPALAALLLAVTAGCTSSGHPTTHSTISRSVAPSSSSSPVTSSSIPEPTPTHSTSPLPDGSADPESSSVITPPAGWALGPGATCTGCARIWHTTDAGTHWSTLTHTLAMPGGRDSSDIVEGLVDLDFLNSQDGYLFIESDCTTGCGLLTTNGGRSWGTFYLPEPRTVVNGGHDLYTLTEGQATDELLRIPIGSSHWTRLPLPRIHTNDFHGYTIAADNSTVAVLQIGADLEAPLRAISEQRVTAAAGALWISTTNGTHLTRTLDPCHGIDGGADTISVVLHHPQELLLDCYDGQQSSQESSTQHHLYGTNNDGRTWHRLGDPSTTGGDESLTDNGAGHAFFVSIGGNGYQLHVSFDDASHWHTTLTGGSGGYGLSGPYFLTPDVGFALGPTHYAPEHLYRTTDAGRTWQQLPLPTS